MERPAGHARAGIDRREIWSSINMLDRIRPPPRAWAKAIAASKPHLRGHALVDVLAVSSGWIDTGLDLARARR